MASLSLRLRRLKRSANQIDGGSDLFCYLMLPKTRKVLIQAANDGVPPVSRLSSGLRSLAEENNELDIKDLTTRQFIGSVVRGILEQEGFEVAERGVKLPPGGVFRTGSVYRLARQTTDDLLTRFLAGLSDEETQRAFDFLKSKLKR